MGSADLIYLEKLKKNLQEADIHLARINDAIEELLKNYTFPINQDDFKNLLDNRINLAFAD